MTTTLKALALSIFSILTSQLAISQCANGPNIHSFTYNGATYEFIQESKTWIDASACAVERGGKLAEIDDQAEQDAIWNEISVNVIISNMANTMAPDGGNGFYFWIGGNDMAMEGRWIWDGANTGSGNQFWQGTSTGSPIGGLYNNWGNEPDDFGDQDGLAFAISNWPLGAMSEWNDVDINNTLYFLVEIPAPASLDEGSQMQKLDIYPNPATDAITIQTSLENIETYVIYDLVGQELTTVKADESQTTIDISTLKAGNYFVKAILKNGTSVQNKIIVQ